jgi:uncharacterized membrane protein
MNRILRKLTKVGLIFFGILCLAISFVAMLFSFTVFLVFVIIGVICIVFGLLLGKSRHEIKVDFGEHRKQQVEKRRREAELKQTKAEGRATERGRRHARQDRY